MIPASHFIPDDSRLPTTTCHLLRAFPNDHHGTPQSLSSCTAQDKSFTTVTTLPPVGSGNGAGEGSQATGERGIGKLVFITPDRGHQNDEDKDEEWEQEELSLSSICYFRHFSVSRTFTFP